MLFLCVFINILKWRCIIGINNVIVNALKTKFAWTDDFQFVFTNSKFPLTSASGMSAEDILDITVKNIDLPQMSSEVQPILMGGEYRIVASKYQPFTLNVVFRDLEGSGLRNYFLNIWASSQRMYFDDIKSSINVSIDGTCIFQSDDCLITSVSTIQLDNSNSQILEFNVEFITPYFSNKNIALFGSNNYTASDAVSELKTLIS